MGRRLAASVRVTGESGAPVVLAAGEELPGWAADQVTNPAAFVEDEPEGDDPADSPDVPAEGESTTDGETGPEEAGVTDYSAMRVADLKATADERGVAVEGTTKADFVAALTAADAEPAADEG